MSIYFPSEEQVQSKSCVVYLVQQVEEYCNTGNMESYWRVQRYAGGDLLGVNAKIVPMPESCKILPRNFFLVLFLASACCWHGEVWFVLRIPVVDIVR